MTTPLAGRRSRPRRTRRVVALAALSASALVLSGCGSIIEGMLGNEDVDDIFEDLEDFQDPADEPIEVEEAVDGEADEVAVAVTGRSIGTTVFYSGLEYTVEQMTVIDNDEGQDFRVHGITLEFDVTVANTLWSDSQNPNAPVTMQWNEPGTSNVIEVSGRAEMRPVPSNATSSGQFLVDIRPDDLELYDDASARLLLGHGELAQAQIPVGPDPDVVALYPVLQSHLVGETFDLGPVDIEIDYAAVQWNWGDSQHGQLDAGRSVVVFDMTMHNDSDMQVCLSRGMGNQFSLVKAEGQGYVDEGVSERCTSSGSSMPFTTGFTVDGDHEGEYGGNYTMSSDISVGFDEYDAQIDIELIAGDGSPVGGSDTNSAGTDDSDNGDGRHDDDADADADGDDGED